MTELQLKIEHLNLSIQKQGKSTEILRDINLCVREGERWAITGESGAGKSMTMYALTSLLPEKTSKLSGSIWYRNVDGSFTDVLALPAEKRTGYCAKKVALILQDAMDALNPFERVEKQWKATISLHHSQEKRDFENQNKRASERKEQQKYMRERLEQFGILDEGVLKKYPHQLSGGMKQRIAIAMALESEATILIADEPTTALDAPNQRKLVEYIAELCQKKGLTLLYISHNLALLDAICTHVAVLKEGEIVESGTKEQVFYAPRHPYTARLVAEAKRLLLTPQGTEEEGGR
ncbi:MAG: ABC transporter ATP-binding protein [bacterium]|nr:ABC transporter ATP-binding protein [bacterium]